MIGLRLAVDVTAKVDAYAAKHGHLTRSDAIRHMIDKCLVGCPDHAEAT
jgi:metal-responsive CopG/Arc/MetJ family transcriptional regulator